MLHCAQVGGIVLHQGRVAEMKTGEGKTLVATLPAYLHGLTGKGVHIVTVNDYLAERDAAWYDSTLSTAKLCHGCSRTCMTRQEGRAHQDGHDYLAKVQRCLVSYDQ